MRMGGVLSDRTVGCSGAACALTGVGATIAAGACGCGGGTITYKADNMAYALYTRLRSAHEA